MFFVAPGAIRFNHGKLLKMNTPHHPIKQLLIKSAKHKVLAVLCAR